MVIEIENLFYICISYKHCGLEEKRIDGESKLLYFFLSHDYIYIICIVHCGK